MSDDGNFTALSSVANNANTEIPRSHQNKFNFYNYNIYAATAENITYAMAGGYAEDSICPANWRLAHYRTATDNLPALNDLLPLYDNYRKQPINMLGKNLNTNYAWDTGSYGGGAYVWTDYVTTHDNVKYASIFSPELNLSENGFYVFNRPYGLAVRCVQRD